MPVDWSKYPYNWKTISAHIRIYRAGNRCEWTLEDGTRCLAINGKPNPITGSKVVLTVAHLDHDTTHNDPLNLMAMCQLHHLRYDSKFHAENRKRKRDNENSRAPIS